MIKIAGVPWKSWAEVCRALGMQGNYNRPADPEEWIIRRLGLSSRAQLEPVMQELRARALGVRVTLSQPVARALAALLDTASLSDVQASSGLSIDELSQALAELRRMAARTDA